METTHMSPEEAVVFSTLDQVISSYNITTDIILILSKKN